MLAFNASPAALLGPLLQTQFCVGPYRSDTLPVQLSVGNPCGSYHTGCTPGKCGEKCVCSEDSLCVVTNDGVTTLIQKKDRIKLAQVRPQFAPLAATAASLTH